MMVDHEDGHLQPAHLVRQRSHASHVVDVQHDECIDTIERGRSARAGFLDPAFQQELEHHRPRCRIHDARIDAALGEQVRQRSLGSAAVAVRVDVRAQRYRHARRQQRRK